MNFEHFCYFDNRGNTMKKHIIFGVFCLICNYIFVNKNILAVTIVLDPGHGGKSTGCVRTYNNRQILEKNLNYKIASTIKQELSNYVTKNGDKISVYLTHNNSKNYNPTLAERVEIGVTKNADAVISIHINASEDTSRQGVLVLTTSSNFNNLYNIEEKLAICFLNELIKIGLKIKNPDDIKSGILKRLSDDGTVYENGDTTDWYGIIRNGILKKIPAILIEHGYLSNTNDYKNYFSTDKKLKKLAIADVNAIVNYFDLTKKV